MSLQQFREMRVRAGGETDVRRHAAAERVGALVEPALAEIEAEALHALGRASQLGIDVRGEIVRQGQVWIELECTLKRLLGFRQQADASLPAPLGDDATRPAERCPRRRITRIDFERPLIELTRFLDSSRIARELVGAQIHLVGFGAGRRMTIE